MSIGGFRWEEQSVVVTGGFGFVGNHLCRRLEELKAKSIYRFHSSALDLLSLDNAIKATKNASLVIHLAALCGGIGFNQENPGLLAYQNAQLGLNILEACRINQVKKVVMLGTICSYPRTPRTIPFVEHELWDGYPEETNAPYGLAKRFLVSLAQAYWKQYGMNIINLLPVNLYGAGDNFGDGSHVIPALIKKIGKAVDDGRGVIEAWGTGEATREFLYVEDAANAICLAAERYNLALPINIGSGLEISIKELAGLIASKMGYTGKIKFNPFMPDGQPRRIVDSSRAKKFFGFEAKIGLEEGLEKSIAYWRKLCTELFLKTSEATMI